LWIGHRDDTEKGSLPMAVHGPFEFRFVPEGSSQPTSSTIDGTAAFIALTTISFARLPGAVP